MNATEAKLREWRENPVAFVREALGVEPDAWQLDVLRAFPTQPRVALQACKGPGKSAVMSWVGWNFLLTRPHPKVVATSITGANLRDGLWTEFALWQRRSKLLSKIFKWSAERIVNLQSPETWWASARQWSSSADPAQQANTLAGVHADYVLFLVDEVGGIPDAVVAAAEAGLATGIETKLFISGNPTHLSGPLYRAATRERSLWWRREITGDPDDPKRSSRVSMEWAREQIKKYGRDNPWVLVNVFGKFPPGQANTLLSVEDATVATQRIVPEAHIEGAPKVLGVDVARFGDDRTVLQPRQGDVAFKPKRFRNLDTMEVAGQVALAINRWDPDAVFVDDGGVGGGVTDRLRQLGHPIIAVNFGGKALTPRYADRRAEMWWNMSEWIRAGGSIPDDGELVSELTAPTYSFDSSGKLRLESKADLKARGLPSPDSADALCLTFAMPVASKGLKRESQKRRQREASDFDPFRTFEETPEAPQTDFDPFSERQV